jgi:nicotinamidase-related amidase
VDATTKSKRLPSGHNEDLHGNAPDRAKAVLLLVDLINDLSFPGNEQLIRRSVNLAKAIARLKKRCQIAGIPTIYVNDNHGKWQSNFATVLRHCLGTQSPGRAMVNLLVPDARDYVILKPKHSAFFGTPLETILQYIGAQTVILAGLTTNACIMITAGELYVRDFGLIVPSDCVAALTDNDQRQSLQIMKKNYDARTAPSSKIRLSLLR